MDSTQEKVSEMVIKFFDAVISEMPELKDKPWFTKIKDSIINFKTRNTIDKESKIITLIDKFKRYLDGPEINALQVKNYSDAWHLTGNFVNTILSELSKLADDGAITYDLTGNIGSGLKDLLLQLDDPKIPFNWNYILNTLRLNMIELKGLLL